LPVQMSPLFSLPLNPGRNTSLCFMLEACVVRLEHQPLV